MDKQENHVSASATAIRRINKTTSHHKGLTATRMAAQLRTTPVDQLIARRLTIAREDADLVKMEMAEKLGITKQGYTPFERGEHIFTVNDVFKIAKVLGRPVEWFLDLKLGDLSEDDQRVLAAFRRINSPMLRKMVIEQVQSAAGVDDDGGGRGASTTSQKHNGVS
jgi:transcriptional regulator with XRE-family HTH domain